MCDYVSWAYTESVDLEDSLPKLESMFDTCQLIGKNVTKMYNKLEMGDSLKNVSTNEIRKDLLARINSWTALSSKNVANGSKSLNEKETEKPKKTNLEGTAGSEHPKYIMFWTNEANLNLLAQYFGGSAVDQYLPLGPSSTVLFEMIDLKGKLDVRVIINDQLIPTEQCLGKTECKATDFAAKLKEGLKYPTTVTDFCKGKAK